MSKFDGDNYEVELSRSMRKLCNGAFGDMSTEDWNHRIPGTNGTRR